MLFLEGGIKFRTSLPKSLIKKDDLRKNRIIIYQKISLIKSDLKAEI